MNKSPGRRIRVGITFVWFTAESQCLAHSRHLLGSWMRKWEGGDLKESTGAEHGQEVPENRTQLCAGWGLRSRDTGLRCSWSSR